MSKRIVAVFAQKSIRQASPQPKPQEYTVLGVNQPIIPPESEQPDAPSTQPLALLATGHDRRRIRFSFLLNKLL